MKPAVHGLFAVLAILASAPSAFAFHVPEHVKITSRAVDQLRKCGLLPEAWGPDWTQAVVRADEDEDYNFLRKWSHYSHYYNPLHPIEQSRADSSASVGESAQEIAAQPGDPLAVNQLIGRIIHHVQDASVPAHVVPVAHASSDGFELFAIDSFYSEPLSPADCPALEAAEPLRLLHDNAMATLEALNEPFAFQVDRVPQTDLWLGAFWEAGQGNAFGRYGTLGNSFGKLELPMADGRTASFVAEEYARFKRARVSAAVKATAAAILWANRVRGL
jgi:hypothetical protein